MSYTLVDVIPDTPEWLEERRSSVGASEVPAVLGLSKWSTPLDVYRSKHGVDREFDPLLSFIGHESEHIIHKWVHEFSGLNVRLEPGFMARSVEHPWLHASFDRMSSDGIPFQFKTAHHYTGHEWNDGIPTDIRIQVQTEMLVAGESRAAVVVWIGGREFKLFWEYRDDRFIREQLIPTTQSFWYENVRAGVAPDPTTLAEVNEIATEDRVVNLSETAFEALERITVLNSDIAAQEAERDQLKVVLGQYVGSADTLTHEGQKVATWKQQKGRTGFDQKAFREAHPELAAEFTRPGSPFRVLRRVKQKDTA